MFEKYIRPGLNAIFGALYLLALFYLVVDLFQAAGELWFPHSGFASFFNGIMGKKAFDALVAICLSVPGPNLMAARILPLTGLVTRLIHTVFAIGATVWLGLMMQKILRDISEDFIWWLLLWLFIFALSVSVLSVFLLSAAYDAGDKYWPLLGMGFGTYAFTICFMLIWNWRAEKDRKNRLAAQK